MRARRSATALDALDADISLFAELERLDAAGVHALCPLLKADARHGIADRNGIRLDPHALLQGNLRAAARQWRRAAHRCASCDDRAHGAPGASRRKAATASRRRVLVNAAGAWADQIARLAGVAPLGLRAEAPHDHHLRCAARYRPRRVCPSPRRSATSSISRRRAAGCSPRPMDEVPSDPCDAQPDEYEVALAAYRMEERTIVKVEQHPQPLGGPQDLHARPSPGGGLCAGCGRLLLAGRAGRVRTPDLAGHVARSRRR